MNLNGQRLVYQKIKPSRPASNIGPDRIPCSISVESLLRISLINKVTAAGAGVPSPLIEEVRLENLEANYGDGE